MVWAPDAPAALRDTEVTGESADAVPFTTWDDDVPDGLLDELPHPRAARVSAADIAMDHVALFIFTLLVR
jgi:hypothetical protein